MTPERDFQGQVRARIEALRRGAGKSPPNPNRWHTVSAFHVVVWMLGGIGVGLLLIGLVARWVL